MQIKKLHDYEVVPSMVVSIVRFTIRIARLYTIPAATNMNRSLSGFCSWIVVESLHRGWIVFESRFPDESRDSSPADGLVILHRRMASWFFTMSRLDGERYHWTRRVGSQDRVDERVSASLFSQPWQSGVEVVSDIGFLWWRWLMFGLADRGQIGLTWFLN